MARKKKTIFEQPTLDSFVEIVPDKILTIFSTKKPKISSNVSKRTKAKTKPETKTKTVSSISFQNKFGQIHTAKFQKRYIEFKNGLHEPDGSEVVRQLPIETIEQILKINYNMKVIPFIIGIYTFEFDKNQFVEWLYENGVEISTKL